MRFLRATRHRQEAIAVRVVDQAQLAHFQDIGSVKRPHPSERIVQEAAFVCCTYNTLAHGRGNTLHFLYNLLSAPKIFKSILVLEAHVFKNVRLDCGQ